MLKILLQVLVFHLVIKATGGEPRQSGSGLAQKSRRGHAGSKLESSQVAAPSHFCFLWGFFWPTPVAYGSSPGQGLNLHHSSHLSHSSDNAGSSTARPPAPRFTFWDKGGKQPAPICTYLYAKTTCYLGNRVLPLSSELMPFLEAEATSEYLEGSAVHICVLEILG